MVAPNGDIFVSVRNGPTVQGQPPQPGFILGLRDADGDGKLVALSHDVVSAWPTQRWGLPDFLTPSVDKKGPLDAFTVNGADFFYTDLAACDPRPGARAAGAPCGSNSQCQSTFCARARHAACGICASLPKPGDSCAVTQCGRNQECFANMTCQPPAGEGAACTTAEDCAGALLCSGGGTCLAVVGTAGAACDSRVGPLCDFDRGLRCLVPKGMTAGTCVIVANRSGWRMNRGSETR